ncbi:MAG TPA: hypothetical protein VF773_06200 [Verrucomicrobiae bacterium]
MAERRNKRRLHPLRRIFRWFRIAVLLVVCFAVAAILWCNLFGVPKFVANAIRTEVQRRRIELDFTTLKLKGIRHLVARDVFIRAHSTNSPSFAAREAEFIVDYERLRSGQFELSGIRLVSGSLTVPLGVSTTNALLVTNINTHVHFVPGDVLRVMDFSAEALGAKARLSGEVKHLWKFRLAQAGSIGTNNWQKNLSDIVALAEQLDFKAPPELSISLTADGTDLSSTRATVVIKSDEATSKWGTFDRLQISSSIAPTPSNNAVRGDFLSEISGFRTAHGTIDSLRLQGETLWTRNMDRLITNHVDLATGPVNARWFRLNSAAATLSSFQENSNAPIRSQIEIATGPTESSGLRSQTNRLDASLDHPLPFPTPANWLARLLSRAPLQIDQRNELSGQWSFASGSVQVGAAEVQTIQLQGTLATRPPTEPALPLWQRLESPWQLISTNIRALNVEIGSIRSLGTWSYPQLAITNLDASLYGGFLKGDAHLDVRSRLATVRSSSDFPYEKLSALLDKPVQLWFSQFEWEDPPNVETSLSFQFPEWNKAWKVADLAKTLEISGRFEGSGKFRGVVADKAESHFNFTNFVWTLPDLVITRPEGRAHLSYSGNVTNGDFRSEIDSRLDPAILKPLFPKEHQPALNTVKFVQPPHLLARATGNWDDDSRLNVDAFLVAGDFFVKEQAFSDIRATIAVTNGLLICTDVLVHRGKEEARVPYLRIDPASETMFVTNIVSTIDPYIAMSLVGEDAYDAIIPYRFAQVPTVRVNGIVPLRHWSKADLHFDVSGNEFTFWRFRMPYLAGHVHWRGDHISFSNVVAKFYGGDAQWSGYFVIDHRDDSANYSFSATATNAELKYLVADLTQSTNHIEGLLDGELVITSANSSNDRSWNGYGSANMRDGFLWNVPIFGIFTPVLDGIAPGLGSSRVTAGSGTYTITNSVVYTRDMQVRAPAFRLGYQGSVDLDGNLSAEVEAQIFRDARIVGKLFSIALWPVSKAFEAKVSGTVQAPKTDLKYVPKFLLAPFRILGSLNDRDKKDAAEPAPHPPVRQ